MPEQLTGMRRSDPGFKWLVAAGVASLAILSLLVAFMADSIGRSGPSGAGAVGFLGFIMAGAVAAVAFGPIGRAIGKRMLGSDAGPDLAVEAEVEELRLQVDDLRQALAETHERMDFTERLLASNSDKRT